MKNFFDAIWNGRKYKRLYKGLYDELSENNEFHTFNYIVSLADYSDFLRKDDTMRGVDPFIRATRHTALKSVKPGRMMGNSTRQIDYYIQLLFYYGELRKQWLIPHEAAGNITYMSKHFLFRRICERLELEHRNYVDIKKDIIFVEPTKYK